MSKEISWNPWPHRLAAMTTLLTFPLIFLGGLVTSHDVALAVPDWPNTWGYNMFLFPSSKMVGGILYEHSHRLVGAWVGFLTVCLVFLIVRRDQRRWLHKWAWVALAAVCIQGILGGKRVDLVMKDLAIFHACLGQLCFCLLAAMALWTSRWWMGRDDGYSGKRDDLLAKGVWILPLAIFIQLVLGAVMRHKDAGLAIPDFPMMYGQWLPPLDAVSLDRANDFRRWQLGLDPVSFFQVGIHMLHRVWALVVTVGVLMLYGHVRRHHPKIRVFTVGVHLLMGLLLLQWGLGMAVIWSGKAADVATLHVVVGALIFMSSVLFTQIVRKTLWRPVGKEVSDGGSSIEATEGKVLA